MKSITTVITRAVDLDAGICHPHKLHKKLIRGNAFAHAFKVACYRDGVPVDISNATCWGYVRRPDGETIELEGTVEGNIAQIVLKGACYLVAGWATISLNLVMDGVEATHGVWVAQVCDARSDHVTDGEPVIPEVLPNPYPLIFTGAVNAVYDGTQTVYVNIPAGGTVTPEEPDSPDDPDTPDTPDTPVIEPLVLPAYWQAHMDSRVADIDDALTKAGSNRNAFLFYSDAHWTYGNKMAPTLLDYLTRNTAIDKVVFGGDIMDEEEDISYLETWRSQLAGLPSHHSVVGNHDDGNAPDGRWTLDEVYQYLLAPEVTPDVVRGADLYYHIDVEAEKTRYIYIDSASRTGYIAGNEAQKTWLSETLRSTPAGWHIVPIAHIWAVPDYSEDVPTAGTLGDGANYMLALFDSYNAREGDFVDCAARVEYCIGGHTHRDDEFYSPAGIPVILVETDSRYVRSGLDNMAGTITEGAVSAIIADYSRRIVHVIRVGRGESRIVFIEDGSSSGSVITSDYGRTPLTGNFTNVLSIAEERDSTDVYNDGNGYANAVRIKSDASDVLASWDSTGYIPAPPGATIRMYNMELTRATDELRGYSRSAVFMYDSNKKPVIAPDGGNATLSLVFNQVGDSALGVVLSESGDIQQFTVPTSWCPSMGYIRLTASDIRSDSIITVNEDIPFLGLPPADADYLLEPPAGTYTNALDTAEAADSSSVYNNGYGYKNRTRLYSGSAEETAENGWDTTGFIAVNPGSVIRMHGMTFTKPTDTAGDYPRSGIFVFDSDKKPLLNTSGSAENLIIRRDEDVHAALQAQTNSEGDIVQFTLPRSWYSGLAYIRITAGDITGASIITVDSEINITEGGTPSLPDEPSTVAFSVDAEGNATVTGAILTVDAEGNATLTGYSPSVDGDGDATIG